MSHPRPLPTPSAAAADHEAAVRRHLADAIASAGGAISFERFMEAVLYAPGLGYYSAGSRKLGAGGDFVTAPEITPLFGRCLARNVGACLDALGGGDVLEVGAGTGALAARILGELARSSQAPRRYLILERSADLRARQRETLAGFDGVEWIDRLPGSGFRGAVVANELLDAIPATRFRVEPDAVSEERVRLAPGGLERVFGAPLTPGLDAAVRALRSRLRAPLPAGYVSEIAPAREAWVASVAQAMSAGMMLLIDYGYPEAEFYHPQRDAGTLRCHIGHRAHDDPLLHPGLQDVSVHVDFSAVARAGTGAGMAVAGFTTQAEFLLASGLLDLAGEVPVGSVEYVRAANAIKTLTLPGQMGDAVKVLVLGVGVDAALPGLGGRDHRGRL